MAGVSFLASCASDHHGRPSAAKTRERLDTLVADMTGTFTSTAQAKADAEYRDVVVHMMPIWKDRTDGRWLLAEQAMTETPDQPVRQWVHRVSANADGTFQSQTYEFTDVTAAQRIAGAWRDPSKIVAFRFEEVALNPGCEVTLTYHFCRELFHGTTGDAGCPSNEHGASKMTSEVSVNPAGVYVWNRWYDAQGRQISGPTKEGYYFVRQRS
jgi:hypothetical protein